MSRPRDSQRAKVYAAMEDVFGAFTRENRHFGERHNMLSWIIGADLHLLGYDSVINESLYSKHQGTFTHSRLWRKDYLLLQAAQLASNAASVAYTGREVVADQIMVMHRVFSDDLVKQYKQALKDRKAKFTPPRQMSDEERFRRAEQARANFGMDTFAMMTEKLTGVKQATSIDDVIAALNEDET